jgi:hypothetical protein
MSVQFRSGNAVKISAEEYPILKTFPVLYEGWECDSVGMVVEKDGKQVAVLTNHGIPYFPTKQKLELLVDTYNAAKEAVLPFIETAKEYVPEYRMNSMVNYTLLTKEDFLLAVSSGMATDENGEYHPVKDGNGDWVDLYPSKLIAKSQTIPDDATHVAWFRKV